MTMQATKSLSDITAIVTGGASGLGNATAEKIIEGGGRVALLDINQKKVKQPQKN